MLAASALALAPLAMIVQPAHAAPGNPGVPGEPDVLYQEDFSNAPAPSSVVRLTGYTGATGQTYRADPAWLDNCNGWITSFSQDTDPAAQVADCSNQRSWNEVQQAAYALGAFRGVTPETNFSVSALTAGNPGADRLEFGTASDITLPTATGRYVIFSVDVAALNCDASAPRLRFSLVTATATTPVGGTINGCTGGVNVNVPALGASPASPATAFNVKTVQTDAAVRLDGNSFGIQMFNANGSGVGNDHAFDNLRVLDVTPQLDKAFGDATIILGETTDLTFTITNTNDLLAKEGWSFDDALPAGMTVAGAATTTCTNGAVTAAAGSTTVTVAGDLQANQASCTATVPVTANAVGQFTNGAANITPDGVNPPADTTLTVVPQNPQLQFDKQAAAPVDVNASGLTDAGDTIQFSFTVTNTGNVPLTDVVVEDAMVGAVTCQATTLAVGANTTCLANAVYTITEADQVAGAVTNTALSRGTAPNGARVPSNEDTTTTPVQTPAPAIELDKQAAAPVDVNASGLTDAGDTIQFSFTVTNTGNVPLTDVVVEDAMVGAVTCQATTLAVGANTTCLANAVYTITEADQVAGAVTNTALSRGTAPNGARVPSNEDTTTTPVQTPAPAIELDKQAGELVDANGDGKVTPGDTIQYSFTVTNSGNVTLNEIALDDPMLGGAIECPQTTLLAGGSMDCTGVEYAITQADIDRGEVVNDALVTGTPPTNNPPVDAGDVTETPTPGVGGLALEKSSTLRDKDGDGRADAGEVISYSFLVTNTGTITVTDVAVDDPMLRKAGVAVVCAETELAPGASTRCAGDYTVTSADVRAGDIRNVATAVGNPPNCDDACEPIVSPPDDTVVTVDPPKGLAATGGVVEWTIVAVAILLIAGGAYILFRRKEDQEA